MENGPGPERSPVLYVAGFDMINHWIATIWKIDGSTVTSIALTDGTQNASVWNITKSEGSLYAAGFEGSGDNFAAMVWKIDGSTVTPIALTDGKRSSSANAVIVLESEQDAIRR
jgi:hypothetical protein